MGRFGTYRDVVLPQMLRIVVPPLGNIFVGQLKGATIMSVIAAPDMVLVAQDITFRYLAPFEAYTAVAVILIAMVLTFSGLVWVLEKVIRIP
jgi:polar amino acid transport system permease protein